MTRNRKEALKAGVAVCETKHSMKRRMPSHNYCAKGTYILTLVVEGRKPLLGSLQGNGFADKGRMYSPMVKLSPLGEAILNTEIKKISEFYPMVDVWKLCIMPDHIHMIVRVKEDMPAGKLGGKDFAGRRLNLYIANDAQKVSLRIVCHNIDNVLLLVFPT